MEERITNESRRDFIKKGAVVGGLAWAAPTVVGIGQAHAQTEPSPVGACECSAGAAALSTSGVLTTEQGVAECTPGGSDSETEATVELPPGSGDLATARLLNATADCTNPCRAEASVTDLDVGGGALSLLVLSSSITIDCETCEVTATSCVADLQGNCLDLSAIQALLGVLSPIVVVAVGQESCIDGWHTISALTVEVPSGGAVQRIDIARSRVRSDNCPCPAPAP